MRPLRVGIVSSVGGHLTEVLELLPLLQATDLFLVVNDEVPWRRPLPQARHYRITHAERDLRQLWNLGQAATILGRERPDVLISTGASPAVPFFLVGRLLGAQTIYIESFASVERPSLTGRLVAPLCHHAFVQWPAVLAALPQARYLGPLFAPPASPPPRPTVGEPLELLVSVGSSPRPCRRLLSWLDGLGEAGLLPKRLLVQGSSADYRPRHFSVVSSLPSDELEHHLATAATIICHGGAGLLGSCLKLGRRPLVVPRRAAAGEVLDDHQLMLCRALAERQLITVCESEPELRAALAAPPPPPEAGRAPALPAELLPAVAALLASIAAQRSRRDPSRSLQSA